MSQTNKLYEKNSMLQECEATVLECIELKNGFGIVLDQTVIFPEGGGQLSDQGEITYDASKIKIEHASEKADVIYHESTSAIPIGEKVTVKLDWQVRLDHMQQHCGEHMLSYAFWKICEANNVGFHMSKGLVTIDLDKEVTAEEVAKAEDFTNKQIWEDLPIVVAYMPHTEVAKLTMRKKNEKLTGTLRIVTVEDGDICTCCGTHPTSTGMVGIVKVTKVEKHKGGSRVEFLCGRWALEDIRNKLNYIVGASNMLSTKEENVCNGISKLKSDIDALKDKLRNNIEKQQAVVVAEILANPLISANGSKLLIAVEEDYDAASAKSLSQKLMIEENAVIAVIYKTDNRVNYMFALSEGATGNCKEYIAKANELFAGKGGGNNTSAQGGGEASSDWIAKVETLKEYLKNN